MLLHFMSILFYYLLHSCEIIRHSSLDMLAFILQLLSFISS
uniref:Uncharacterized protein n=1 Tax=Anguilla anguilla TaxID=7936 RepID=A0A0E9QV23_ANGAN